jgi:hypothetical protein
LSQQGVTRAGSTTALPPAIFFSSPDNYAPLEPAGISTRASRGRTHARILRQDLCGYV